jgi:hypothetical protein
MTMLLIALVAPGTCLAPKHAELTHLHHTHSFTHDTRTKFTRYRHLRRHMPSMT